MIPVQVSTLSPDARTREGRRASYIVTGTTTLTPEVVTTEAWSPTIYSGNRRTSEAFLEAWVVGFDIDDGMTVEEAKAKFADYAHIIGTTTNHQKPKGDKPPCDRFRLILFLEEPALSARQYKQTLIDLATSLGIPMDPQAKDAARWFIPCREIVSYNASGKLVPVSPPIDEQPQNTPLVISQAPVTATTKGRLSRATLSFLAQEPSDEGWHIRFIKAAMDLKEQGYTEEEAAQKLRLASPVLELDETDLQQLRDVYQNRGGALDFRLNWPDVIPPSKTNPVVRPVPHSIANLKYLILEVLGFNFMANKRRQVIYYTERPSEERKLLDDFTLARIKTKAREYGLSSGADATYDLIQTIAQEHAFDPLLDQLDKLEWDGGNHIERLFQTITLPEGTTDEARNWYYLFLRRWIIGIVTKVYKPGSENNVLVLQGAQAAGKSRWLKRLAEIWPEGFGEGSISPDDKDHELRHLDNFIWHVAEFDSTTSRREVGALKDYFTKDTVNVRRPYARLPIVGRSICSFCASVNSHEFLHDATGNRRYLVIPVVALNPDHDVSIKQVLAEAKHAMEQGERQWFTREEIEQINALNEHFLSKEEYLELLEAYAEPGDTPMTLSRLMETIGYSDLQLTRPIRSNIRAVLERNGVTKRVVHGTTKFFVNEAKLKKANAATADILSFTEALKSKQIK